MPALIRRHFAAGLGLATLLFAVAWVANKAFGAGFAETGNVPEFVIVGLNGVTLAGLYFIGASGFTLIFGLMRVVNLAHGSLYLFGAYIALELASGVTNWWLATLVAALCMAVLGLSIQQVLLRWNLGQELRQALITIALSIILADVMLHGVGPWQGFGALAETITPPASLARSVDFGVYSLVYPLFRLAVLGAAVVLAFALWLMIQRTRLGMAIRAGVDDRAMASALGLNIQLVFAVVFFLGSALAGLGGALGGTMLPFAPGSDTQFLLSSLIVVVIGGMGSLAGAAVGALALGLVDQLSRVYLPESYTNYSILLTFALLVFTLAVRPYGLFGRLERAAEQSRQAVWVEPLQAPVNGRFVLASRALALAGLSVAALVPFFASTFFTSAVGVKVLWLGMAAASLIFLNGYVGMVSLAQTALYGIAGYTMAKLALAEGLSPWHAALAGLAMAVAVGLVFGLIASRTEGIYFLMITLAFAVITYYFFSQVPSLGGHEGFNDVPTPKLIADPVLHPMHIYYVALVCSVAIYLLIRYFVRTPFGLALQGVRDEPARMRSLGFNVVLLRTAGFGVGALIAGVAGVFSVWHNTRISPGSIDITRTIDVLTVAVVGGLFRLEGAWIGALLFTLLDTYTRGYTERFETWIGLIFLAIVILSPGGLVGLWSTAGAHLGRLVGPRLRRRQPGRPAVGKQA